VGHYGPVKHTSISLACSKAYHYFFPETAYNFAAMFLHMIFIETIISAVFSTVLSSNYYTLVLISFQFQFTQSFLELISVFKGRVGKGEGRKTDGVRGQQ